jgi:hypothetical protein
VVRHCEQVTKAWTAQRAEGADKTKQAISPFLRRIRMPGVGCDGQAECDAVVPAEAGHRAALLLMFANQTLLTLSFQASQEGGRSVSIP